MTESSFTLESSPGRGGAAAVEPSATFVVCIENNETCGQALLLIESLRAFGGRFSSCPVLAVAPRAGLGVDAATRARLDELAATYHEEALNTVCPEYGSANRVYAAAWAARHSLAETLFVLDSDTLFLGEPGLPEPGCDLAVRPVDVKGPTSEGPGDPFESYWAAMCGLAGMPIDALPFVETVLDRRRVRASYNGGYAVVRRASGILERAAELFTRSVRAGLRPYKGARDHRVFASTGLASPAASEYWGSNQAALSIAAWSTTRQVAQLDRRFNLPLHGLADPKQWSDDWADIGPVHVHYHWLLRAGHREQALLSMAKLGVPADRLEWTREHATLIETWPAAVATRPAPRAGGRGGQLVITGMHRSATSLVANLMQQAGLEIGDQLMGPGPGNRRGHFEDRDFYVLHEQMLAAIGSTALMGVEEISPPADPVFAERARALIARRGEHALWGWKDPRSSLFLDFWDALLPRPRYLFLYRHPLEVALSLRRRYTDAEVQLDPWAGLRAWGVYNRYLLRFCERHSGRCFLAQVPALTADLPGFVRRVAEKLDLPLDPAPVGELFSREELGTDLAGRPLSPAWEELIPESLDLYRRLEVMADLPSSAARVAPSSGENATLVTLLHDLRAARMSPGPPAAGATSPELDTRWTVVERRHLGTLLSEVSERRRMVAELERGVEAASSRRDELAATLAAIESSRSFRLVALGWRLVSRLKGRPRRDDA